MFLLKPVEGKLGRRQLREQIDIGLLRIALQDMSGFWELEVREEVCQ